MGRSMEYSQVGHFGWILAPILILDRETRVSFCRALGSQFHLGAVQIQVW